MSIAYDDILVWMTEYFSSYNKYAQNPETVGRMRKFFTPDVRFIPFVADFGGPGKAVTSRDEFFRMFTGHPTVYEQFVPEDMVIDEKRMCVAALLNVELFDAKTGRMLLRKSYLPHYKLVLNHKNEIRIKSIMFFWEALPPEVDKAYDIEPR